MLTQTPTGTEGVTSPSSPGAQDTLRPSPSRDKRPETIISDSVTNIAVTSGSVGMASSVNFTAKYECAGCGDDIHGVGSLVRVQVSCILSTINNSQCLYLHVCYSVWSPGWFCVQNVSQQGWRWAATGPITPTRYHHIIIHGIVC